MAEKELYCLDEPTRTFWFEGYGDSAVLLRFNVWFASANYWEGTNRIQQQIYKALTTHVVEFSFLTGPYQPVVKVEPRCERPFSASSALQNLERPPVFLHFCALI